MSDDVWWQTNLCMHTIIYLYTKHKVVKELNEQGITQEMIGQVISNHKNLVDSCKIIIFHPYCILFHPPLTSSCVATFQISVSVSCFKAIQAILPIFTSIFYIYIYL